MSLKDKLNKAMDLVRSEHAEGQSIVPALRPSIANAQVPENLLSQAFQTSDISSVVVEDIDNRLATRDTNKLGFFAFLNRKGEEARTNLAEAQTRNARANAALEVVQLEARTTAFKGATLYQDLLRAKRLEIKASEVQLHVAQQQIELIAIQTNQVREAAAKGFTFAAHEELLKKEAELTLDLRRIEETERIKFEFEERKLNAETEAIIRLANTDELVRAQMTSMLDDYIEKRDRATSPEKKADYQFEIDRLRRRLRDEQGGVDSEADAGEDA